MPCKSKNPKPQKKTVEQIAIERAVSRIPTVDMARKVKISEL